MKELGITKGKMKTAREYTDEIWGTEGMSNLEISDFKISLSTAVGMMENFSEETNSELLERYNEAIAVMSMIRSNNLRFGIDSSKRRVLRLDDEEWGLLEQTISKANRE